MKKIAIVDILIVVGILGIITSILIPTWQDMNREYEYGEGEYVIAKIDNRRGMVVRRKHCDRGDVYTVRFVGRQTYTDSRVMSDDGAITTAPYSDISMMWFEIAPVEIKEHLL